MVSFLPLFCFKSLGKWLSSVWLTCFKVRINICFTPHSSTFKSLRCDMTSVKNPKFLTTLCIVAALYVQIVMRKRFTKSTTFNFIVVINNNEIQSRQGNGFTAIFGLASIVFPRIGIAKMCHAKNLVWLWNSRNRECVCVYQSFAISQWHTITEN